MATNNAERPTILQWGLLAMLLGAIALTVVGGIWLFNRRPNAPGGPRPTADVRTTTPTPVPTSAPTRTPQPISPGTLGVGVRVQVNGTGASGLSIRSEATTAGERLHVAEEGERLLVVGGPEDADGYTWWLVRDEASSAREGWAVADFLSPVE